MGKWVLKLWIIAFLWLIFLGFTMGTSINVTDIHVLNEQSYPIVGKNWTIMFKTSWLGNLTISPINGTSYAEVYEDNPYTEDDLEILQLKCGNLTLFDKGSLTSTNNTYLVLENDSLIRIDEAVNKSLRIKSIFVENYLCDNFTSNYIVGVLTSGKHHLKLEFDDKEDYASNSAASGSDADTGGGMTLQYSFYTYGENGVPCTDNPQCSSGICTDGYCCNAACGEFCKACDVSGSEGTCTFVPDGQDLDNECAISGDCNEGNCDGAGACDALESGEGACPACQTCSDTDIGCENIADTAEDTEGSNTCGSGDDCKQCDGAGACENIADNTQDTVGTTCNSECVTCDGAGNCENQGDGEDLFNQCTLSGDCNEGNCDGAGACDALESGEGECPACKTCSDTDIACENVADTAEDTEGINTCGSGDDCKQCDGAGACENIADGLEDNVGTTCGDSDDCKQCDGAGACENIADNTQDTVGTTCNSECTTCDGAGNCENQGDGEDLFNQCYGDCTQECDGAGACYGGLSWCGYCDACNETGTNDFNCLGSVNISNPLCDTLLNITVIDNAGAFIWQNYAYKAGRINVTVNGTSSASCIHNQTSFGEYKCGTSSAAKTTYDIHVPAGANYTNVSVTTSFRLKDRATPTVINFSLLNITWYNMEGNLVVGQRLNVSETSPEGRRSSAIDCTGNTDTGGKMYCGLSQNSTYDILFKHSVYGTSHIFRGVSFNSDVSQSISEGNATLNITLRDNTGTNVANQEINVIEHGTNNISCFGDTDANGVFVCALNTTYRYDIHVPSGANYTNVSIANEFILEDRATPASIRFAKLTMMIKDTENEAVSGKQIKVYEAESSYLACTGSSNKEGIVYCGLDDDKIYDILYETLLAGGVVNATVKKGVAVPNNLTLSPITDIRLIAPPTIVTLQGKLTDTDGTSVDTGSMYVQIINDGTGVTEWSNTFNDVLDSGVFNIGMGSLSSMSLTSEEKYKIVISVDINSATYSDADLTFGDNDPAGDLIKFVP